MEQKGCYIFGDKGCEVKLRYEYEIYDSTLEKNFMELTWEICMTLRTSYPKRY